MKPYLSLPVLVLLLAVAGPCFGMMSIEFVTQERAKQLGMTFRTIGAGPDAVRVEFEFEVKGDLAGFSRVDLESRDGGKATLSATLREDRPTPGHVVVSFVAGRAELEKLTLRVVVEHSARTRTGHDLRVKEFVDLSKVR